MSNRVLISMPDDFMKKVDDFAKESMYTRSELIRNALREYMFRRDTLNKAVERENV